MSWCATLIDDRNHVEGDWSYTHNCNGMIEDVLGEAAISSTAKPFWSGWGALGNGAWWDLLDGKTGPEGQQVLDAIIAGLKADPAKYRAMNPDNGWGSYDTLLEVLTAMRNAVPDWPCQWVTSG